MFLGQLTMRKRVDVLMRAFAQLQAPNARLVVAGNDMGAGGGLHTLARSLGIERHTIFAGLLRGDERLHALADADVVVYPSEHEIFGLVPLEAPLSGTPVIVSDDSGCGEVVRSTGGGQVIAAGDPNALTDALRRALASQRSGRAMAADAAVRARALYGDDIVCAQLEQLYSDMVNA